MDIDIAKKLGSIEVKKYLKRIGQVKIELD